MVWPTTKSKAHMLSNQQLEKEQAERKSREEREERRREREFFRRARMPAERRGSGSTAWTTTTDTTYRVFGRIGQGEERGETADEEEEEEENIYDAEDDDDDGPAYSDDGRTEIHGLTRQQSILLQSSTHSSEYRHDSPSPPTSSHYSRLYEPHMPSHQQTQTDSLPSTLPITHTIPSAQPHSSVPFSSSSRNLITQASSSDHFALSQTYDALPSPTRSQTSSPDFFTHSSGHYYPHAQTSHQQEKPISPPSPPSYPIGSEAPVSQATTASASPPDDPADEIDSSQDSLVQQRARKCTEDISDPRIKTPRKAHGQVGNKNLLLQSGRAGDRGATGGKIGGKTGGRLSERENIQDDVQTQEGSTLYDAVVDGIARMEVAMGLDDAGRWRIQRTDEKRPKG